jgi:hypothetical protein
MKILAALLLLIFAVTAPAAAWEIGLDNRPAVVFKGGATHQTPYPQSNRAASVWHSDACWSDCKASCTWKMEYCVRGSSADECRPNLDACDRSCQRSCRAWWQGPLLGFMDF